MTPSITIGVASGLPGGLANASTPRPRPAAGGAAAFCPRAGGPGAAAASSGAAAGGPPRRAGGGMSLTDQACVSVATFAREISVSGEYRVPARSWLYIGQSASADRWALCANGAAAASAAATLTRHRLLKVMGE